MSFGIIRRFIVLLSVAAVVGCGDDGPSDPPVPAAVLVTPSLDTLVVTGGTAVFSAQAVNKKGKVLAGLPISWRSLQPSVAVIDANGVATAVGKGTTQIQAMTAGVRGIASLTVSLLPVSIEITAGNHQTGSVGAPLDSLLSLRVVDGAGAPIRGVSVTLEVTQGGGTVTPAQSVTWVDGTVSSRWTLGPNPDQPQEVVVRVGNLSSEFHATAVLPPVQITTTDPHNGRPTLGYEERFQAEGGIGSPYFWSISDGDLPLGLTLSADGFLSGTPEEEGLSTFSLRVQDGNGSSGSQDLNLRICPAPVPLAPGESRAFTPSNGDGCGFFLPAGMDGDRYRIGIVRSETNRDEDDVVAVTLDVRGMGILPVPGPQLGPTPAPASVTSLLPQSDEEIANATEAFHLQIREEERRLLASLPPDFRPLPSFPEQAPSVVVARSQAAPKTRLLRFPSDGCAGVSPKPALLLGENEHVAVYQDSVQYLTEPVSPGAVAAMLDYYRAYGKRVIDQYFGGVSDVNGDGQVIVFVTPGIRDGVAGFVRASDLMGREFCSSSNEMEITYLKASFVNGYDRGAFQFVGTLVHEIKHISSLYQRLVAGSFHPSWVEEGTAEIATDRASRLAIAETGGPGVGAMLTMADLDTFGNTIEGYNTRLRLSRSLRFMASQPNSVTVNPYGASFSSPEGLQERHTIYGASWHFHRWLGDAYGGAATAFSDTTLFRRQNDSLTASGPDAYPELVGKTFSELMEEFALAVILNGTGAPAPMRAFTSFDFPSAMSSTSVYSAPMRPFGGYPWPVTGPVGGSEGALGSVSLKTATYSGQIGESGLRIHDLISNGTGLGAEVTVFAPPQARVIVVRLR